MLGKEICLIDRKPKGNAQFGVAWYYPNTYTVGMSGLGYQLIHRLLEDDQDIFVKRGFTDSKEPHIEACDLIGFTLSWELDFINILNILDESKIALSSQDRTDDQPLIFAGGPVLTANPEPFFDIFDVILMGDAESMVPAFIDAYKEACKLKTRHEKLLRLSQVKGIYVPKLYAVTYSAPDGPISSIKTLYPGVPEQIEKQLFMPPSDYVAHSVLLCNDTTWGDMFLVEVVRSCPQECRFCLASFLTRPFRATNVDTLLDAISLGLKHTNKVGLLGPSVTEHPRFEEIAQKLRERKGARISIASVRADSLSLPILETLKELGQKSVTIAIESGSERLRGIMKKNLSESEIEHAVDLIDQAGLDAVKFYGIAGLPHEEQGDLDETVRLMKQLKKKHKRLRFVFGVSSFVPKAQTPFQWSGRCRKSKERIEYLRKHLAKAGIEVRPESHNWSDIQALLSRGDRRLAPLLLTVAKDGGKLGAWKKALRQTPNIPDLDYYVFRDIPQDEILPWSHLADEHKTSYLAKHNQAAVTLAGAQN